ncbi:MAG: glycosyltransferase family 39 protein, partial [Chloroflexota bacterium]
MRTQTITILSLTLAGFALRLYYLTTTHPFFDEYTTVLAARQILRQGWPVLPSGLFYEHGLLATYMIAPFTALFIDLPLEQWQPAHWGLMLARWPSVLIGTVTIPLLAAIGRRGRLGSGPALLAAGLFALSPEGMVWGGRARMYALATLLVLLTVYWAYRGAACPAPARYRRLAIAALLATLLTQFGAMPLIPPLLASMLIVGWLSHRWADHQRPWLLQPSILAEGLALAAVIGLAVWVKRLGRPLGAAAWDMADQSNPAAELFNTTIAYQTTFHVTWADTILFLARQFGVPHHFWLTMLAILGAVVGAVFWLIGPAGKETREMRDEKLEMRQKKAFASNFSFFTSNFSFSISNFPLFLWLVFGLIILEMVTLLDPFRRNPRYLVMYLPLFYLIAAHAIFKLRLLFQPLFTLHSSRFPLLASRSSLSALILLTLFTLLGRHDLQVALLTPEPAYDEAFAWLAANRQPGDALLTMNTPAAGLYLGRADGFTVQVDARQFLLDSQTQPVDRWLGTPWVGAAADFNAALNAADRAWFVIDAIRRPVYFRGDWLAVVNSQMGEPVWAKDNALIYRTRAGRLPLPAQPDSLTNATLGDNIRLIGYTLRPVSPSPTLQLTLFWQPLAPLSSDYTVFVHLRNAAGATVGQSDRQPLDGAYPTT